jgi:DNA-binding response OmpR family regulator
MTNRIKILIVEDEMPVAMMMAYLLNRVGCEVETACNAKKGLQLARSGNFDLITLDVDLPGMNGFEICRRLKEDSRLCQTPIFFVSSRPFEEGVQHGLRLGAADYIIKPFEVTDFIFRIISHAKPKADFDTFPVSEGAVA